MGRSYPDTDWHLRLLADIQKLPTVDEKDLDSTDAVRRLMASERLRPSEIRVLEAASRGLKAGMIADLYGLSRETVRKELTSARRILRAKNTTHAVAIAIRAGLLTRE